MKVNTSGKFFKFFVISWPSPLRTRTSMTSEISEKKNNLLYTINYLFFWITFESYFDRLLNCFKNVFWNVKLLFVEIEIHTQLVRFEITIMRQFGIYLLDIDIDQVVIMVDRNEFSSYHLSKLSIVFSSYLLKFNGYCRSK